MAAMRCSLCQSFPPLVELGENWEHHPVSELTKSANNGCDLCAAIFDRLFHSLPLGDFLAKYDQQEKDAMRVKLVNSIKPDPHPWGPTTSAEELAHSFNYGSLRIDITNGQDKVYRTSYLTWVLHRADEPCPQRYCRRLIAPSHRSAGASEFVSRTAEDCCSNHKECAKNIDALLPTYTIFVGTGGGVPQGQDKIRIVHNQNGALRGTYLTLSYCWGGPQPIQLTKATVDAYQRELPISSLPPTLRDAVFVTQQLGYKYLWIDALCIVQDDEASRGLELANMGRIYSRSFLTIQASMARSVQDGFLASRRASAAPVELLLDRGSEHRPPVVVYGCAPKMQMALATPAAERAWIFQEGTLTPRLLMYMEDQILFVCHRQWVPEDGTNGPIWFDTATPNRGQRLDDLLVDETHTEQTWRWYIALPDYTARKCAVSDDRLTALAGFAEMLQPSFSWNGGGRYLAGLWEADLVYGLQWKKECPVLVRAASFRAPSWSWAAYEGKIGNIPRSYEPKHALPRVVSAWTTPKKGYTQYGPCSEGRIVLETTVGRAYCGRRPNQGAAAFALQATADGDACCEIAMDVDDGVGAGAGSSHARMITCAFLADYTGLVLAEIGQVQQTSGTSTHAGYRRFQRIGFFFNELRSMHPLLDKWRQSSPRETIELV